MGQLSTADSINQSELECEIQLQNHMPQSLRSYREVPESIPVVTFGATGALLMVIGRKVFARLYRVETLDVPRR